MSHKSRTRRAVAIAAVLAASAMLAAGPAFAADTGGNKATSATVAKKAKPKKAKPKKFPINGQVSLSSSAGLGTFVPGEQNRTSIGTGISMFFLVPMPGLSGLNLAVVHSITKTLVDYAEDPYAVRSRNTQIGDVLLLFLYTPMVATRGPKRKLTAAEKAELVLNPTLATSGKGKPLKLPGDIGVSFQLGGTLPTSKTARFQTRLTILRGAVNFTRRWGKLAATWQLRAEKRFNRYSNWVVDYGELGTTPLAREDGAENIGDMLVANDSVNIAYSLRNRLLLTLSTGTPLSLQLSYRMSHNWDEYVAPKDEFTSPHAKSGRGRSDLQLASASANYSFHGGWDLSFTSQTWSEIWSDDNQTLRWPFFDPRYASNNITTLNLSLTKSF